MAPVARPDTKTLFHIDLTWFEKNSRDLSAALHESLCGECRVRYPAPADTRVIDRVHPQSGEVTRADALWESIVDHCALKSGYITPATPLTAAIFRALIANGNQPLSSEQLQKRAGKSSAAAILKLLLGSEIENGVVLFEQRQV